MRPLRSHFQEMVPAQLLGCCNFENSWETEGDKAESWMVAGTAARLLEIVFQEGFAARKTTRRNRWTAKKMGAGDCKVRHQKPRPQICVVSKVTFGQAG
jgi:hypothetical protein